MKKLIYILLLIYVYANCDTKELVMSISSNPSRINPILSTDSASSEISDWIFNGLFKYDKNGNIICDLAKSYKFIDSTTLIINLRENVKWHDGKQFTADDVIFTYNLIKSPKIYTPITTNFIKVSSIKKIDDFKIEIKYKEPYFKALVIWMTGILPKHILENEKDLMTSSFNKNPIGTGPYKLKELKLSQDIVLEVNKNYYLNIPKIEKIRYKFVPDTTTAFYMLSQKQLDIGGLNAIQVDRQLKNQFRDDFNIYEKQSFSYTYLGFNLKNEKFKNKKIREAISLAIDKQQLVDILYFGHGKVCNGPFLPDTGAFNSSIKTPKQDIKKAKEILKELGFDEKNKFTFTVITNADNNIRVDAAQILQYQLLKANIDMKIKVMEWQAFLNTVVHPRNFEALILGWGMSLTADARSIWHSKSNVKGGFNFIGYENKEVDNLIEEAEKIVDEKEFFSIYQNIYKKIALDLPYVFLYIPNSITAINRNIKNVNPAITGIMHNQYEWIKIEE